MAPYHRRSHRIASATLAPVTGSGRATPPRKSENAKKKILKSTRVKTPPSSGFPQFRAGARALLGRGTCGRSIPIKPKPKPGHGSAKPPPYPVPRRGADPPRPGGPKPKGTEAREGEGLVLPLSLDPAAVKSRVRNAAHRSRIRPGLVHSLYYSPHRWHTRPGSTSQSLVLTLRTGHRKASPSGPRPRQGGGEESGPPQSLRPGFPAPLASGAPEGGSSSMK